jgi:HEPN domain-containing protein
VLLIRDLRKIARARLRDAEVLSRARRFDGSVYVCGYAVEIALKARICRTLRWAGYPDSSSEFQGYTSFRSHDLDVLLRLSGRESILKSKRYMTAWSVVAMWDPETRYLPIGKASAVEASAMLRSAREVLSAL